MGGKIGFYAWTLDRLWLKIVANKRGRSVEKVPETVEELRV
jgi:hypothetical protein